MRVARVVAGVLLGWSGWRVCGWREWVAGVRGGCSVWIAWRVCGWQVSMADAGRVKIRCGWWEWVAGVDGRCGLRMDCRGGWRE